MSYSNSKDFQTSDWIEVNEDRGVVRRHRVYKQLLMTPGMYRKGEQDEDFEYLKNYGNRMNGEFEKHFNCQLQVHRNSAFLIMGEECEICKGFPENNTLSDIILLCNQLIYQKVKEKQFKLEVDESIKISDIEFDRVIEECKTLYGQGFISTYRKMTSSEIIKLVGSEMERLAFIEKDIETKDVIIRPIVGKVIGFYPNDYKQEEEKNE